jgi:DNA-binding NtrC family response regulator
MTERDRRTLRERRDEFERNIITETLDECAGSVKKAARRLGMSRSGLHKRIRILGIRTSEAEADDVNEKDAAGDHD